METLTTLDLEQYKIAPVEAAPNELAKINSKLEELAQDCFEVEEEIREQLLHQKALYIYPKLDTSFLSLSAEREWKYELNGENRISNIKVPRFSIHQLDEPKMIMRFSANKCGGKARIISPNNLPKKIVIPLLETVEFFDEHSLYTDSVQGVEDTSIYLSVESSFFNPIPNSVKRALEKYRQIRGTIEIQRAFSGLIPIENKKTIREAQKVFDNEIFLLAEAKPEDWNIRRYILDPIVAGVIKGDCFYIDKFNTTPLEEYVKTGFSQTN